MSIVQRSAKKISVFDLAKNPVAEIHPSTPITIMYPDEYGEEIRKETKLAKHATDQEIVSYVEGSICN